MKRPLSGMAAAFTLAITMLVTEPGVAEDPEPPLVLETTIPLEGVSGRIDHMAIDLDRKRLFVAELGNNSVDVIALSEGRAVHRLTGFREPQGVGYAATANLIVIANAGDGTVRMFRDDFAPVGSVALGENADNVRIDPRSGVVMVGYGSGGLALIDPKSRTKVAGARVIQLSSLSESCHSAGLPMEPCPTLPAPKTR